MLISGDRRPKVGTMLSSVSTNYQKDLTKHRGDEIHTKFCYILIVSRCFINQIFPITKTTLREYLKWWLEFLPIQESIVCHVLSSTRPCRWESANLTNAASTEETPSYGVSTQLEVDGQWLGNLAETLPYLIIFPLCCWATLLLPNDPLFSYLSANSNCGMLSWMRNLLCQYRNSIRICDDGSPQPEGLTQHFRVSMVGNHSGVDIKCSVLKPSISSVEFMVMDDMMW